MAKKYDIDYALKKDPTTDPPHYYVFFKAKDIISAATVALLGLLTGFDITLFDILKITIPATLIGVLVR